MTITTHEPAATAGLSDKERFGAVLAAQQSAQLRDGAPSPELMPVVTAIAAGHRVMLKPSKYTPVTNALLTAMIAQLYPEEQVPVVSGDGSACSSLAFDHIVFTGSSAVGRAVVKAASENLVPVTLDLGGKSPTIVARGRVTDKVESIVFGKLLSGGQACIAPDYALVHESEVDTFVQRHDALVKAAQPDGPTSVDYTSIVNQQQYDTLVGLIADARAHGATVIEVGHRPQDAALRPHTFPPTVVLGVTDEMRIAHEEIFGPILPMHVGQDDRPFGGVGESGMGKYHGIEASAP